LNHYVEIKRSIEKFLIGLSDGGIGMISGAVGTYSNTCPELEKEVLKELGLKKAAATNQIIQRDIYARIILEAAILATTFDRLATEIRLLSHSEINEVSEPFSKGQKGSSAMPHKKNPIRNERISGLSRLLRGFTIPALEDIVLWHERDISHSSVERIMFPDCFHIIAFLAKELIFITKDIYINKENIEKNLERSRERFYSGVLLTELLKNGVSRKKSYEMIQPIVFESIKNDTLFSKVILKNEFFIEKIGKTRLKEVLSLDYFKRYIDDIFEDVEK
jgi:adenylosuccinate lyase